MSRKRKTLFVGALVAAEVLICATALTALVAGCAAFPGARVFYFATTRATETVEETFATDGPATLDLTNTRGNVEIVAGDGDRFVVKAFKEVWGQGQADADARLQALKVETTMDGNTLHVRVDDPSENTLYLFVAFNYANQVRFEVTVPRQTDVTVQTRNGHISLRGTAGNARLVSRYGNVAVEGVAGGIAVDTRNGEVTVRRASAEREKIELQSHYGNVMIRETTARELVLNSNNGALTLETVTVEGDLILNTHYGQIDLDGVRAGSLKGESRNGDIALDDVQLTGKLDLLTHYGDVSVARTEASDYRIETHNGAIDLAGGRETLWLHSHYGAVTVKDARNAILDLYSNNGKVTFEGALAATADHQVESHYGAVVLRLPPNTAVALDASTDYGRIRCAFEVAVEGDDETRRSSGDDLRGTINGGGVRLRVKTHNGNITIE